MADLSQPLDTGELIRRLTQKTIAGELGWGLTVGHDGTIYHTDLGASGIVVQLCRAPIEGIVIKIIPKGSGSSVELPVLDAHEQALHKVYYLAGRVAHEYDRHLQAVLTALEE